jgi:hypothetical protein
MDAALISFLLDMAVSLSGLPPVPARELPPLRAVSEDEMRQTACPEAPGHCRNLVAMFDTERYRILYLDSLDTESAADNSFLVHEFVHVLQYRRYGDAIYAGCRALLTTEAEAYRVQNAYLRREGELMRVGDILRFTTCPQAPAEEAAMAATRGEWRTAPGPKRWDGLLQRPPHPTSPR